VARKELPSEISEKNVQQEQEGNIVSVTTYFWKVQLERAYQKDNKPKLSQTTFSVVKLLRVPQ
jgi:hypothetical protein